MRRALKIALGVLAAVLVLLILNAIALSHQTKDAEVNIDGGEIVQTSIGGLQVLDEGDPRGSPIVLIHCYTCSMKWWDKLAPLLTAEHRVIRIDLLGHGGSEMPKAGYAIEDQARGVAEALSELDVDQAIVVGHSLGGTVATALATESPDLVAGVVDIDQAPDNSYGDLGFTAKLGYVPVIGQAIDRLVHIGPASAVEDQYHDVFAPGFSIPSGFDDPDQVVEDLRAMTYTAFTDAGEGEDDYTDEQPLTERLTESGVPLLVIFGAEDQIYDAEEAIAAYREVPGARTALLQGAGHSPNVEIPDQVAPLILKFAADQAASQVATPPPATGKKSAGGAKKRSG
jgi:pimeloyl-ACP methyl ester carboxylesterase